MTNGTSGFICDADLHGLADGHIEPERRADALRHVAGSPVDRARVEAWQGQNDLLRHAFAGIDREPVPASLDLSTRPKLHCVPANDSSIVGRATRSADMARSRAPFAMAIATFVVLMAGAGGIWMVLDDGATDEARSMSQPRGSVERALATRASDALAEMPSTAVMEPTLRGDRLPTTQIPDLQAAGFSLKGADVEASEPASIQFRYQNSDGERLVVSVARALAPDGEKGAPVPIGGAFSWHKRDQAFALAGTLRPGRLRAIALSLQNDESR